MGETPPFARRLSLWPSSPGYQSSNALARASEERHPDFDPREYMKDHPITATGAQRLFLGGIEKVGRG